MRVPNWIATIGLRLRRTTFIIQNFCHHIRRLQLIANSKTG
jgi:hypothetical protein